MKFLLDIALKLLFLVSLLPFILAEKINTRLAIPINNLVIDSVYTGPKPQGELENKKIDEASGLVASRNAPGVLYTHNDSGGKPEIYKIDTTGGYLGKIILEGVQNRDWEDIAIGPGPQKKTDYIYVGEIGDNNARYKEVYVYRFPEPEPGLKEVSIRSEKLTFQYPRGARDAETLMVDPWSGDLFIVSKRDSSNVLYRAAADKLVEGQIIQLEELFKMPITVSVAGDISPDGRQIIIKNYWVNYYWERKEGESIPEALARKPIQIPYNPEPQGEAVAFSHDGASYYTLSEKRFRVTPVLYRYYKTKQQ